MADDLIDRLRAEETRMCRLHDAAVTYRDKHRGQAFADLNALKHAIAGRDPVLTEAADEIGRLRAALVRARNDAAGLRAELNLAGQMALAGTNALARAEKAEREREALREAIAQGLDDEADVTPCAEDAAVVRGCARLVRANFSYDEADRLAALTPARNEKEG